MLVDSKFKITTSTRISELHVAEGRSSSQFRDYFAQDGDDQSQVVTSVNYNRAQKNVNQSSNLTLQRLLDVVLSVAAIIFLLPIFVLIAALIKMHDRGHVIFSHRRVGEGGALFDCYKFRSMVMDSEARLTQHLKEDVNARKEWHETHKLTNDPRITRLGNFLRKTSLDELPQFFNVLQGNMSLVGPRPIITDELPKYGRFVRFYLKTRPGITGLWQISGRSDVSYRQRVALDILYTKRKSLGLYFKILIMTVPAVLLRKGSR